MIIDEEKMFSLSNFSSRRKTTYSDHNSIIIDLCLKAQKQPIIRNEVFNFKDQNAMKKFTMMTNQSNKFSRCFENKRPFRRQIKDWIYNLKNTLKGCFKKVRIKPKYNKKCSLFKRRKSAIRSKQTEQQRDCDKNLAKEEAKRNIDKIRKNMDIFFF